MPTSTDSYKLRDSLLPGHWFQVTFFGALAGKVEVGAFSKISGIKRSMEAERIKEGGRNWGDVPLPTRTKHNDITLEYGVMNSTALWDWSRQVDAVVSKASGGEDPRAEVLIEQMDHAGQSAGRRFVLVGAWPTSWAAGDLDAQAGKMTVDTLTLVYEDLLMLTGSALPDLGAPPAKATLKTLVGSSGVKVTGHYNPENLKLGRKAGKEGSFKEQELGTVYSALTPSTGGLDTLSFDWHFDNWAAFGAGSRAQSIDSGSSSTTTGVEEEVSKLHKMTLTDDTFNPNRPPLVQFEWGDMRFKGLMTSFSADYTYFDKNGAPLRAKVSLGFEGQYLSKGDKPVIKIADGAE